MRAAAHPTNLPSPNPPSPPNRIHNHIQDRVCEVRSAATAALQHLARVTGPSFVETTLLPRVLSLYENAGFYLVRVAVLQALRSLALEGVSSDPVIQSVLGLVLSATRDRIPNVRFTAAQV